MKSVKRKFKKSWTRRNPISLVWIALLLTSFAILSKSKACAQSTITPSSIQLLQEKYVRALEDSNITLQAIRPAYQNQILVNKLQNDLYNTTKLEWLYKEKMFGVQVEGLRKEVKGGEKQERKAFWKGVGAGSVVAIILIIIKR
jgi:hypothetical protein